MIEISLSRGLAIDSYRTPPPPPPTLFPYTTLFRSIYVANASTNDNITIYAPAASGNATPIDTIAGSNTGLNAGGALALDSAGNLYVANYYGSSITVYAPGASGNATPTTTIAGSNTGLSAPLGPPRDAAGNLYVVNSWSSSGSTSITVYTAG